MFKNLLLRTLSSDIIERLSLRPVTLELHYEIETPGSPIENLYFLESGLASMTASFHDGFQVEVGMYGRESVIGASALMGTKRSLNRVYMQTAGQGYSCAIETARAEFRLCGDFQDLILRSVQSQYVLAVQSVACNTRHTAEQRLARWLLLYAERSNSKTLKMSHDFLASTLGSTRPTVSLAAETLKEQKLIDYTRGVIRILDFAGLEQTACECYHVIKNHLNNYAEFDSGTAA